MKFVFALMLLLGLFSPQLFADDVPVEEIPKVEKDRLDAVRVGRAISEVDFNSDSLEIVGSAYYFDIEKDSWEEAWFIFNRGFMIAHVIIGDEVMLDLERDDPVETLPIKPMGYKDYNFNIWIREGGYEVAYGYFFKSVLLPGHKIRITMNPNRFMSVYIPVPEEIVDPKSSELCLDRLSWCSEYDPDDEGYYVYVPEKYTVYAYTIYGLDGNKLYKGEIDPFDPYPGDDNLENSLSVTWKEGFQIIYFPKGTTGLHLEGQALNARTRPADCREDWCATVPVAGYVVETNGSWLDIMTEYGMIIDVYDVNGNLIVLSDNYWIRIDSGYEKVIVIIRRSDFTKDPVVDDENPIGFSVSFAVANTSAN